MTWAVWIVRLWYFFRAVWSISAKERATTTFLRKRVLISPARSFCSSSTARFFSGRRTSRKRQRKRFWNKRLFCQRNGPSPDIKANQPAFFAVSVIRPWLNLDEALAVRRFASGKQIDIPVILSLTASSELNLPSNRRRHHRSRHRGQGKNARRSGCCGDIAPPQGFPHIIEFVRII